MRMEATFILTELRTAEAAAVLLKIASAPEFADDEIRQAAVWGLGKSGAKRYEDLVPFLKDPERDVVLHAIAGFGADTPKGAIERLISELNSGDARIVPAASEALRNIGSELVLSSLIAVAKERSGGHDWLLATMGRLSADMVRSALKGDALLERLGPLLLLSNSENWVAEDSVDIDLKFLLKQNL